MMCTPHSAHMTQTPMFLALDDTLFRKPVEVGSILMLESKVIYAPGLPGSLFIPVSLYPAIHIENAPSPAETKYGVVTSVRADVLTPKYSPYPRIWPSSYLAGLERL